MKKQIKLERGIRARFLEGVINQKEIIEFDFRKMYL